MSRMIAIVLVMVGVLFWTGGCQGIEGWHSANPQTTISADPWGGFKVSNNKDVSVKLQEATYDPTTKVLTIKGLEVVDSASTVRKVNVDQIDADARRDEALGRAWANGFLGFGQLIGAFNPASGGATIAGPFGGTLTLAPTKAPMAPVIQIPSPAVPTTQPVSSDPTPQAATP